MQQLSSVHDEPRDSSGGPMWADPDPLQLFDNVLQAVDFQPICGQVLISDLALVVFGGVLWRAAQAHGWAWLTCVYIIPYLLVNHWLVSCGLQSVFKSCTFAILACEADVTPDIWPDSVVVACAGHDHSAAAHAPLIASLRGQGVGLAARRAGDRGPLLRHL